VWDADAVVAAACGLDGAVKMLGAVAVVGGLCAETVRVGATWCVAR
jgi:hypothetical protein